MKLFDIPLRPSLGMVLLTAASSLVWGLANVGLLATINRQLSRPGTGGTPLLWGFAGLVLLVLLTRVLSQFLAMKLSQRALHSLRGDLTRRILAATLDRVEELGPHRLQAVIGEDVGKLGAAIAELSMLCVSATTLLASLIYLGLLAWRALVVVLALMIIGIASYQLTVLAAYRRLRLAREEADTLHKLYRGAIRGGKELRLNASRRRDFLSRLSGSGERVQALNVAASTLHGAGAGWGQSLVFAAIGLLLFAGGRLLPGVSHATMTTFTVVILYMFTPIQMLSNLIPGLAVAQASRRKLAALDLPPAGLDTLPPDQRSPVDEHGFSRLELVGVTHRYRGVDGGGAFTLGPIDLTLERGELLFIGGGNGSGKTTLAKAITGLYRPLAGEIRLDGRAIGEADREALRQRFAAVFSDCHLFDFLPRGDAATRDGIVARYLQRFQLDRRVTVVGSEISTTELSQGQSKRLALLIALLEDRPIIVLDEWAAEQDPQWKEFFYYQLLPELRAENKTVIVISHDERYYAVADRLIMLSEGRIVDDRRQGLGQQAGASWAGHGSS